jgi:hypothetical protein
MNLKILQGDALAVLKTLPDESVQCCVTSPPLLRSVVQRLALLIERIAVRQHRRVHNALCRTAPFPCSRVLLALSQAQQQFGIRLLDYEEGHQDCRYPCGQCVGSLPAKKRSARFKRGWPFWIIASAERFSKKAYRAFMHHAKLKTLVVNCANGVFPSGALDANISLTINQTGQISDCSLFH